MLLKSKQHYGESDKRLQKHDFRGTADKKRNQFYKQEVDALKEDLNEQYVFKPSMNKFGGDSFL